MSVAQRERSTHVAPPRYATPRSDRPTAGGEAAIIADILGLPLLPWQRQVLDVALEYEVDASYPLGRRYVYREIVFGTPRQSGKSVITLIKTLHRVMMHGDRNHLIYSMQGGTAAARKLLDDWLPIIEASDFRHAIKSVRRSQGSERMEFRNGSTAAILNSAKSAGHGLTLDEALLDEVWADVDDRREQAVVPAMITRPNAQLVITSTAGTDESLYWRRKVDLGRELALAGDTEDVCYFEWSFPDEADPYDEDVWWAHMPALGHTQPLGAIRHAAKTMREDEFRRAFGNQWTRTDNSVIDWSAWVECRDQQAAPQGALVFSIEVNEDRTATSILAASRGLSEDEVVVEVVEHTEGIAWAIQRLVQLRDRHYPVAVLVDGLGPAAALIPDMERAGLPVRVVGGSEMTKACGAFYDRVMERRLRVRPHDGLDDAVAGAAKRQRGDAFVWHRSSLAKDISLLNGATLATWGIAGDPNHGGLWLW